MSLVILITFQENSLQSSWYLLIFVGATDITVTTASLALRINKLRIHYWSIVGSFGGMRLVHSPSAYL